MAKKTRPLSGELQRKYFRELFRAEAGVTPDAAERLSEACSRELAQIRVRLPLVVRRPARREAAKTEAMAPVPDVVRADTVLPAPTAAPAFDPHAFSLIVTLRKAGKDGLRAKLAEIADLAQLQAIARAQHISLGEEANTRDTILDAMVAGTERRVAHREAAAS